MNRFESALEDAKQCVALKSDWAKGYSRLGAACLGLGMWDEAEKAYTEGELAFWVSVDPCQDMSFSYQINAPSLLHSGLSHDSGNQNIREALASCQRMRSQWPSSRPLPAVRLSNSEIQPSLKEMLPCFLVAQKALNYISSGFRPYVFIHVHISQFHLDGERMQITCPNLTNAYPNQ